MDSWNRRTDLKGEWKRLDKEHMHICKALGHRQQCGEGWGYACGLGGEGEKGEIEYIFNNVNNKKFKKNIYYK